MIRSINTGSTTFNPQFANHKTTNGGGQEIKIGKATTEKTFAQQQKEIKKGSTPPQNLNQQSRIPE